MAEPHKFQFEENAPVHVWSASLDVAGPAWSRLAAFLSAEETARARRFHFERDQRHYTAARGLLRLLLGRYLEREPTGVCFGYGLRGKPFLAEEEQSRVRFNVSHSHGHALLAFAAKKEVGVDLELGARLGNDWPGLVKRIFGAREREELFALPAERQRAAFLNGWTRKEAFLKATGQGLVDGLHSIEVSLDPGRAAELRTPAIARAWSVHDLRDERDHAAAVVVEGTVPGVVRFAWEPGAFSW